MRVEIIGCQGIYFWNFAIQNKRKSNFYLLKECKQMIGLPPYGRIKTSSVLPIRNKLSCQPNDGYLFSNKAWCPRKKTGNFF
jgi:hypothetical protein